MVWPNPLEVATLIIDGNKYSDWETVLVKHELNANPAFTFKFTCSEGLPISSNIMALQIRPGCSCTIKLGGLLAFTGMVSTRQVYYDADRHHIEIQGAALDDMYGSAVIAGDKQEFIGKTPEQILRATLEPMHINLVVLGGSLPSKKIPRFAVQPGIKPYELADQLLRDQAKDKSYGIATTSDPDGNFVVIVGPLGGSDQLKEGENILEGRCLILNQDLAAGRTIAIGQMPAHDHKYGPQVTHMPFKEQAAKSFAAGGPRIIVHENPSWDSGQLQQRVDHEGVWNQTDAVTVWITVQGWMKPSGGLWERGKDHSVTSPMLIMNDYTLRLKAVTFTQDDKNGTRTVLELRNTLAMGEDTPGTV